MEREREGQRVEGERDREYIIMTNNLLQKYSTVMSIIFMPFLTSCGLSCIKRPHYSCLLLSIYFLPILIQISD